MKKIYLSLKLKDSGETMIKVSGKDFITCKALLFQIPVSIYMMRAVQLMRL